MDTVDYQPVLADLRARRARLDLLIAGIEAEYLGKTDAMPTPDSDGASATASAIAVPVAIHPDTFFGLTIIDAVKKYLRMAKRAQHAKAISDALDQGGLKRPGDNVLSGILVRAAKGREIVKVGRGLWGLSEWYPKAPREPREAPERRSKRVRASRKPAGMRRERPAKAPAASEPLALAERNGSSPRGALSAAVKDVLRGAGKPVHVTEITRAVNERGVQASRGTVEGRLNTWTKTGAVTRSAPGTYSIG